MYRIEKRLFVSGARQYSAGARLMESLGYVSTYWNQRLGHVVGQYFDVPDDAVDKVMALARARHIVCQVCEVPVFQRLRA